MTSRREKQAEAEGAAAGQCPFCEGGMDAFGGVHTKDCPMVQPPVAKQSEQGEEKPSSEECRHPTPNVGPRGTRQCLDCGATLGLGPSPFPPELTLDQARALVAAEAGQEHDAHAFDDAIRQLSGWIATQSEPSDSKQGGQSDG